MAYKGYVAELVLGLKGMAQRDNRLIADPSELYDASGVTLQDQHARKEAGAIRYDDVGVAVGAIGSWDYSTAGATDVASLVVAHRMQNNTPPTVTFLGRGFGGGASITITTENAAPVGGFIFVVFQELALNDPTWTVTDSTATNSYTQREDRTYAGGGAAHAYHFSGQALAALPAGGTITLTPNAAVGADTVDAIAFHSTNIDSFDTADSAAATTTPAIAPAFLPSFIVTSLHGNSGSDRFVRPGPGYTPVDPEGDALFNAHAAWRVDNPSPGVIALHDWWPTTLIQRLITGTADGRLLKDDNAGNSDATTLKSGLSALARAPKFVAGGQEAKAESRKLFYFNGYDPVQVLTADGTTTTNIANPPVDWTGTDQPVGGVQHTFRLVGYGNVGDPHRAYFSDPDDHEDFTTADAFTTRIRSDIGDRLFCGIDFQGILWFWKYPRGIFYLDDSDTDIKTAFVRVKSEALGCAPSPHAALALDDDVLFMTPDGNFHLLSAVADLGGLRSSNLTLAAGMVEWTRRNVNTSFLDRVVSVWYPHRKTAEFAVPSIGQNQNDLVLRWDFSGVERGEPPKFTYSPRDKVSALAMRRFSNTRERPMFGEGDFIYFSDQDARNKEGSAYTGAFQTQHHDFGWLGGGMRARRKNFDHVELIFDPVSTGTASVTFFVDGTQRGGAVTYDATSRRQKKRVHIGDGYTLSVRVENATLDADFKVLGILVYFNLGNEDQSR